jgi:hypothetical protein
MVKLLLFVNLAWAGFQAYGGVFPECRAGLAGSCRVIVPAIYIVRPGRIFNVIDAISENPAEKKEICYLVMVFRRERTVVS